MNTCVHHWKVETPIPGMDRAEGQCLKCGIRAWFAVDLETIMKDRPVQRQVRERGLLW